MGDIAFSAQGGGSSSADYTVFRHLLPQPRENLADEFSISKGNSRSRREPEPRPEPQQYGGGFEFSAHSQVNLGSSDRNDF